MPAPIQIVVVDLEATCWRNPAERPSGEQQEIIEIGVCLLDTDGKRSAPASFLIRPTLSAVSSFCTELTGHTEEWLDVCGLSFSAACRHIEEDFAAPGRVWASYGNFDRVLLQQQCDEMGVSYPFGPTHLNIKALLALHERWAKEMGLARACKRLNHPLEGRHHRGVDDAWNAAWLLARALGYGQR